MLSAGLLIPSATNIIRATPKSFVSPKNHQISRGTP